MLSTLYMTANLKRRLFDELPNVAKECEVDGSRRFYVVRDGVAHKKSWRQLTRDDKRILEQRARRLIIRFAKSRRRDASEFQTGGKGTRYVIGLGDVLAACGPIGRELMARRDDL